MKAMDLIEGNAALWRTATHHAFLDGVRDGTIAPAAFARWLSQDYHFAVALTRTEARALACAPREDLELLVGGIQEMVAELDFDALMVGDGVPIREGGRERLRELVASFPTD